MAKELEEALKNIKIRCHSKVMWYDPIDFDLETVEQALFKAQKLEKAWGIVKEKNVEISWLKVSDDLNEYNVDSENLSKPLTQEEFELLKEMLE